MRDDPDTMTLPFADEGIAPVRILNVNGRRIRLVPATKFRRAVSTFPARMNPTLVASRERRRAGCRMCVGSS